MKRGQRDAALGREVALAVDEVGDLGVDVAVLVALTVGHPLVQRRAANAEASGEAGAPADAVERDADVGQAAGNVRRKEGGGRWVDLLSHYVHSMSCIKNT